jgi:hypothetical protein
MKKLLAFLMTGLLLTFPAGASHAAKSNIVEVPDVKIVMDGKITPYKDVPICSAQSTLLPLRELLVNLGVPNDEQHILYDNTKKSVTVIKDQTKLSMTVGDKTAYINDQPVQLKIAPIGYEKNQRIYIPFRFVAEALGKKVLWDGDANAILVCDASRFDSIKQILDQSKQAMKQFARCRLTLDMNATIQSDNVSMKMGMNIDSQIDKPNKAMYMNINMNMLGMDIKTESYYSNNASYTYVPLGRNWQKTTYSPKEYDSLFTGQSNNNMLESNEPLCAGLVRAEDSKPGEILLKGDVILNQLFNTAMKQQNMQNAEASNEKIDFDKFYVEMSIDKNTKLINSIIMKTSYTQAANNSSARTEMDFQIRYTDYNGNFKVVVPDDVLKNAVLSGTGKAVAL